MKANKTYPIATIFLAACFASLGVQSAPRSTPVSVVNDESMPVPVSVQSLPAGSSEPQFVGFSSSMFNGGSGVVTYTNDCQNTFPGSHMCTSEEFLNSDSYPAASGSGWLRPTYVPISTGKADSTVVQDISGLAASTGTGLFTCNGWSDAGVTRFGLTVDSDGRFGSSACNLTKTVACCQ